MKETANKDAIYTGDFESASGHKFMAASQDSHERHSDSGEIDFCDFHQRKDICHPVAVTFETPPDSARTLLPATDSLLEPALGLSIMEVTEDVKHLWTMDL